jgi:hypothetical protein
MTHVPRLAGVLPVSWAEWYKSTFCSVRLMEPVGPSTARMPLALPATRVRRILLPMTTPESQVGFAEPHADGAPS